MKMNFLVGNIVGNKFVPQCYDESILGSTGEAIWTVVQTYSSFDVKKVKNTDYYYMYSKRIHIPSDTIVQIDPIRAKTFKGAKRNVDNSIKKLFNNDFGNVVNIEDVLFLEGETRPKIFWDIWHNIIIVKGKKTLMDFARWIEIAAYSNLYGSGEVSQETIANLIMNSNNPATQYALRMNKANIKINTSNN